MGERAKWCFGVRIRVQERERDKERDRQGVTARALTGVKPGVDPSSSTGICELGEAGAASAVSRITAISTYYPSCLSAEWPCGHALAPGKLNGLCGMRGQSGRTGGKDRGMHKGFGHCITVRISQTKPRAGSRVTVGKSELDQAYCQTYLPVFI